MGGPFAEAKIIASVGSAEPPFDLDERLPWSRDEGIEWRWVEPAFFRLWSKDQFPYVATMMDRFRLPFPSEFVHVG